jgi:hypothetical protein
MGGVDLKDQLLHIYVVERKSMTKWYLRLFKRLLNSAILNSILVYRLVTGINIEQLSYRIQLMEGLFMKYVLRANGVYRGGMHPITQFHD